MRRLPADAVFLLLVAGYYALQALLRLWVSGAFELDEAALLVHGQRLRVGYGAQFPLYDWVQWTAFQLFGPSLATIVWTKALVLWSAVALLYGALRHVAPPLVAGLAAASMLFVPEFGWEAQRSLSHSIALIWSVSATLFMLARLTDGAENGRLAYLALGLVLAAGILSKANYWLFLVALALVVVAMAELRQRLSPRGLALAGAVAVLAALPYYAWMFWNRGTALSSVAKFTRGEAPGDLPPWLNAAGLTLGQAAAGLVLAAVVLGVLWGLRRRWGQGQVPAEAALFLRAMTWTGAVAMALLLLGMTINAATHVTPRWMLPMFLCLVPAGVAWLLLSGAGRAARGLAIAIAVMAFLMMVGLTAGRLLVPNNLSRDFATAAAMLDAQTTAEGPVALSGRSYLSANIARTAPERFRLAVSPGAADILLSNRADELDDMIAAHGGALLWRDVIEHPDLVDPELMHSIHAAELAPVSDGG